MRRKLLLAAAPMALATMVACATVDEGSGPLQEDPGPSVVTEAGAEPESDAAPVPDVEPIPPCSKAGWCPTALPDTDLVLKDIWPLPGRAFAIAESPTLGVKVLEWVDAEEKWKYIDDNTQNQSGLGAYAGGIWAPNADELFYGVASGTIYHGKRGAAPETAWTWERSQLEDHTPEPWNHSGHDHGSFLNTYTETSYSSLGVRGIGGDVYAWYANAVYRWTVAANGSGAWVLEHTLDDVAGPEEHAFFVGAAGTSAEDVWFVGVRAGKTWVFDDWWWQWVQVDISCPVIARKTAEGYERIFDGDLGADCAERDGVPTIGGEGWLVDLQALSGNRFAGILGGHTMTLISPGTDSDYSVAHTPIQLGLYDHPMYSAHFATGDQVWLSGMGIVVRGDAVWDGGAFGVSTISLNGGPINRPMYRIRGTSDANLWAVGVRHALHKTTH